VPVSVKEVKEILDNAVEQSAVEKVIETIDEKLAAPEWLKDWRCGTPEKGYFYRIVCEGELNNRSKKPINHIYSKAGWIVEITNSSENNERPGLCGIVLRMPAEQQTP
jgi:hypothetical protein